jgi:hypothetical protein
VQRQRGGFVGLEDADRGDVDPGDRVADRALAQVRGERLDLWEFGHAIQSARGCPPTASGLLRRVRIGADGLSGMEEVWSPDFVALGLAASF